VRRRTAALILAAGTLGAAAVGSGLTAWANWSVEMTNGRGALKSATLPTVDRPIAEENGSTPLVRWDAVRFASGHPVGGYLVIRHSKEAQAEACRVPVSTLSCSDNGAMPGTSVTYTVRAIAGTRWVGPASPASGSVRVTGKPGEKNPTKESSTISSEAKTSATGTEQKPKQNTSGPVGPGTPTTTADPEPTPVAPTVGAEPEATDEVAPTQTVAFGLG
jgi:hypothetical protein